MSGTRSILAVVFVPFNQDPRGLVMRSIEPHVPGTHSISTIISRGPSNPRNDQTCTYDICANVSRSHAPNNPRLRRIARCKTSIPPNPPNAEVHTNLPVELSTLSFFLLVSNRPRKLRLGFPPPMPQMTPSRAGTKARGEAKQRSPLHSASLASAH